MLNKASQSNIFITSLLVYNEQSQQCQNGREQFFDTPTRTSAPTSNPPPSPARPIAEGADQAEQKQSNTSTKCPKYNIT